MSGQQKSPHEEAILACIVLFLVLGISWVIWAVFHVELTNMLRWIRVGEMYVTELVAGKDFSIMHPQFGEQSLQEWRDWLPHANAEDISVDYIKVMTKLALQPLNVVFTVILGLMMLWSIIWGPQNSYRRKMGLDQLMQEQAKSFRTIAPFVKFNPNKLKSRSPGDPVPSKLPIFAEPLAPEEWIAYNKIEFKDGKLNYAQTYRALAKQLGGRWQGPQKLPIHARGLYAAFALKSIRKRKEAEILLEEMALAWNPKSGFSPSIQLKSKINKIIKNPKICGALNKATRKHAYQTTALCRALQRAREEGGVLAPAVFVWLRAHDRNLWYPLNNLGRRSYHPEAAGALAHLTNELIAGQKIPSPRFEEVIKTIEQVMTGPDARPVPKRVAG